MDCHESSLPRDRYDNPRTSWASEPMQVGAVLDVYKSMVDEGLAPEFPVDDHRSQRANEQNQGQYAAMLGEQRLSLRQELQGDYTNDEARVALGAIAREANRADFPMHWDDDE